MIENHVLKITKELNLQPRQVAAVAVLLEEGATVPFIARYRKERTGELDEVQITAVRDRIEQLAELDKRREAILSSLEERKLLTEELKSKIGAAETVATLEDIYLPFRPKKRTKATIAKERGLEPLADRLWEQEPAVDPEVLAAAYVDAAKEVPDVAAALAGARDILAERISDDAGVRAKLRNLYLTKGVIKSRVAMGKEEEGSKFKDYFDWSEPAATAPSHRILAIRRGEAEGFLYSRLMPPEEDALAIVVGEFVKGNSPAAQQVRLAAEDSYKRLLGFAMEAEARMFFKKKADEEAIRVFAENLRELLLASPLGRKNTLAIDPAFRTGCKVVVLDKQGKLLHHDVIYPEKSTREQIEAAEFLHSVVKKYNIEAIAIGNGTASRETEAFVKKCRLPGSIPVVVVSEAGASIYSASEVAREEFPDLDLTVRGAVSIGRRLMDPLAELVKIDPKSIGVGQYQHDVDQNALKRSLDDTVISCVNNVGVELNTASKHLLGYVSGLNSRTAASIVAFRDTQGPFKSRRQLLEVPGLGPKAFEQAAGFLRIRDGEHPLDASAVHPERYALVDNMAADVGCQVADLLKDKAARAKIRLEKYVTPDVGLPTLRDILEELAKPGRDPRQKFEVFEFAEGVHTMEQLQPGMKMPGIVTNVTAFGAFVDVGVHQDGLVHISQLSDQFVKSPADVVKVGQKVHVTVMEVDLARKRIGLSMKSNPELSRQGGGSPGSGPSGSSRDVRRHSQSAAPQVDWFAAAVAKGKKGS
ncbi:MAG: Tex family protein [Terrimicrobiaceae bacterium]